jgi:RNA methyltransferase, TrmH family
VLSRGEIKRLRALARPRARAETGLFAAEGVRLVEDMVDAGIVLRSALVAPSLEDTERGSRLAGRLRERVPTLTVTAGELAAVAQTETPQGVVVVAELPHHTLDGVVPAARSLVVVLDAVQDPGNFGTIVRSAEAFGAACVIALPGTVDPWNPKVIRAAMGSSFRLPVVGSDLSACAAWLGAHAFRILGADVAGRAVEAIDRGPREALVLGNEGAGLREEVKLLLDEVVAVPIRGRAESLNVGVAAGILLYLLARKNGE